MNQHLGIPVLPLVKFVVGHFRIIDGDLMGDNEARLRLASNDEISQISIVRFDIALAGRERQTLQLVSALNTTWNCLTLAFSKSLPKLKLIEPLAAEASDAPGSLQGSAMHSHVIFREPRTLAHRDREFPFFHRRE